MLRLSALLFLCIGVVPALCQTSSPKYQPGTILAVERSAVAIDSDKTRYEVTVQIDETQYVVLYEPVAGSNAVELSRGLEFLFLVGKDTLTLATPGKLDGNTALPILSTTKLSRKPTIDWSKAPGQYYSMKMKNLSTALNLSDEQQAKIQPIAAQETAEAAAVIFTPVVSRKERLGQWEKIVRSSDIRMKPILSEFQWRRLQEIRRDQKHELRDLIANQDSAEKK